LAWQFVVEFAPSCHCRTLRKWLARRHGWTLLYSTPPKRDLGGQLYLGVLGREYASRLERAVSLKMVIFKSFTVTWMVFSLTVPAAPDALPARPTFTLPAAMTRFKVVTLISHREYTSNLRPYPLACGDYSGLCFRQRSASIALGSGGFLPLQQGLCKAHLSP
jgi:hypothetical protein